jgi:hypothetical protein
LAPAAFTVASATNPVPGWTLFSGPPQGHVIGVVDLTGQASGFDPDHGADHGENALYINNADFARQTLGEDLTQGYRYTLTVAVSGRLNLQANPYRIELLEGENVVASDDNGLAPLPSPAAWVTSTITYDAAFNGGALGVRLSVPSATGVQVLFDNVRLTKSPLQPALTSARSRRAHGAAGAFDIAASTVGGTATEPRAEGSAPQMVLTYSAPPTNPGCGGLIIINGICTGTSVSGNDLIVNTTFNLNACVQVTAGAGTAAIRAHQGDVTGDGNVNLLDLQEIKTGLFQPVSAANFKSDVNADGSLNLLDLQATKTNLFQSAEICP